MFRRPKNRQMGLFTREGWVRYWVVLLRRLKQKVQQALRDKVVRLRRQGKMNKDAAEFLGINPQHAGTIWQKHVRGGKKEVLLGTRGRRRGQKRTPPSLR